MDNYFVQNPIVSPKNSFQEVKFHAHHTYQSSLWGGKSTIHFETLHSVRSILQPRFTLEKNKKYVICEYWAWFPINDQMAGKNELRW